MTALSEVEEALQQGLRAAVNLRGYVLEYKPYAVEITDDRIVDIRRGIAALAEVRRQLQPCTLPHEQITYDPPTACYCNAVKNPPCTWCTDGGGQE